MTDSETPTSLTRSTPEEDLRLAADQGFANAQVNLGVAYAEGRGVPQNDAAAVRGAAVRSIQEVAGHAHLSTTQRYMHLSPAAKEAAIRLLDSADGGEIGETKQGAMN